MSRAMFLSMTAEKIALKCEAQDVGVSVLEELPCGGVRLVCDSSHGAEVMRRALKTRLLSDDTERFRWRSRTLPW